MSYKLPLSQPILDFSVEGRLTHYYEIKSPGHTPASAWCSTSSILKICTAMGCDVSRVRNDSILPILLETTFNTKCLKTD